ncbi:hypothetical protein EV126DRAFT_134552 [Verticillium dahliae]|nr:hypothetical protein EV126DRAFT_134552 [Verticillium dahliae]
MKGGVSVHSINGIMVTMTAFSFSTRHAYLMTGMRSEGAEFLPRFRRAWVGSMIIGHNFMLVATVVQQMSAGWCLCLIGDKSKLPRCLVGLSTENSRSQPISFQPKVLARW